MPLSIERVNRGSVPNEHHARVEVAIHPEFPSQFCAQFFDPRQRQRCYSAPIPVAGHCQIGSLGPSPIQRTYRDDVTVQIQVIAFYELSENRPQVPAADTRVVSTCWLHDDFVHDVAESVATAVNHVRGRIVRHKNDSCSRMESAH